ncbi:MAG: ScyD/ScyE family protein, partial [Phormidesmis sp.]
MQIRRLSSFLALSVTLFSGGGIARAATLSVVADGLNQTRGFNFGPDGTLYIPEPGVGGSSGKCQPSPSTLFQPICEGNTGQLTAIAADGTKSILFKNFQSLAEQPSQNQGAGLDDIGFDSSGNAYLLAGFAGYPGNRDKEISQLATKFP